MVISEFNQIFYRITNLNHNQVKSQGKIRTNWATISVVPELFLKAKNFESNVVWSDTVHYYNATLQ